MFGWKGVPAALLVLAMTSCGGPPPTAAQRSIEKRPYVAALGRFEPKDRVIEVSGSGDERLSRLLVQQGQIVKAGDILAYLDLYETRRAARDRAAALLQDAEAQLRTNTDHGQARIREAELQLVQTKQLSVHTIDAQQARVREIHADLDIALKDLDRIRALREAGAIAPQEMDRQSARVDRLRAALQEEEATLLKLKTSADTERDLAEAQLVTRKAELESVRTSAQLLSLRQTLRLAETESERSVIRAPLDGQIFELLANPGETLQGRVILRMGDVRKMYVVAEVYESDISRVRVGQKAEISSTALSRPLTGTVELVGTSVFKRRIRALDPQADTDSRVVEVRIRLDDSQEAARFVGLQVDVNITLDE